MCVSVHGTEPCVSQGLPLEGMKHWEPLIYRETLGTLQSFGTGADGSEEGVRHVCLRD